MTWLLGDTCSFACGENWHDPVKCMWLKRWIKKCDDDSETSNWIAANTKVTCLRCHGNRNVVVTTVMLQLHAVMLKVYCFHDNSHISVAMIIVLL